MASGTFKLTIPAGTVTADLVNYPVYINLSASAGVGGFNLSQIFTDLGDNKLKLKVTKEDMSTECYVEVVSWNTVTPYAELWFKAPNLYTASDNIFYLMWNSAWADNNTYVGVTGSVPAKAVWDANFVAVYHMNDVDTSTIIDSIGVNSGIKKGVNEPIEAVGGVGKAQDFDGSDDFVNCGNDASIKITGQITVEAYVYTDTQIDYAGMVMKGISGLKEDGYMVRLNPSAKFLFRIGATTTIKEAQSDAVTLNAWNYIAGVYNKTNVLIYTNSTLVTGDATTADIKETDLYNLEIGRDQSITYPNREYDGKISEVRISNIARSADWILATNKTLTDILITYTLLAEYSGQGIRNLSNLCSFSGQTNRIITALAEYSALTNRLITKLAEYAGQTRRRLRRKYDIDKPDQFANMSEIGGEYSLGQIRDKYTLGGTKDKYSLGKIKGE